MEVKQICLKIHPYPAKMEFVLNYSICCFVATIGVQVQQKV